MERWVLAMLKYNDKNRKKQIVIHQVCSAMEDSGFELGQNQSSHQYMSTQEVSLSLSTNVGKLIVTPVKTLDEKLSYMSTSKLEKAYITHHATCALPNYSTSERGHVTSQSNNSWNNMRDIFKKMGQRAFGSAGQPAKRPSSPPASSAPKKGAAPAKGLFKGHNVTTATVTSDQPTASVSTPRIPLLFLDSVPDWPTHAKKLEELARDGLTTTFRGGHYRVKVTTVEDFRAVQGYLCSKKPPFYTHNLGRERSLKVVISGLPDTDDVDVLTDEGFAVDEVARLRTARGPTRSWLITLTRDSERKNPDTKQAC
ncbi:hypothetical protein J6590_099354 [Homalodisca vitripennis]|nr:hypothetical protein J6590_099354 [Homalodisca vitripennis]